MNFLLQSCAVVFIALAIIKKFDYVIFRKRDASRLCRAQAPSQSKASSGNALAALKTNLSPDKEENQPRRLIWLKMIYHKLQSLNHYSNITSPAKDLLSAMLAGSLGNVSTNLEGNIMSIGDYKSSKLRTFIKSEHDKTMSHWQDYVSRRRAGTSREMFKSKPDAVSWLKQTAPLRFIDGAWLGHIHKARTPYNLRQISRPTWRILCEELGDGDQKKNHFFVYHSLTSALNLQLPYPHQIDFIMARHRLDHIPTWEGAVGQLLISLFPDEFLPEILGYTMSFESIKLETLMAAKELEELAIDPTYFLLHISIDNAESGHTATAVETAIAYLELVRSYDGEDAVQKAWRRVQAGYLMAESIMKPVLGPSTDVLLETMSQNDVGSSVIQIFKAKASVAQAIHCGSAVKFGGRTLFEWLDPTALKSETWQSSFLHYFSNAKPWVIRGNAERSRLVREIGWGGKMFGAFTSDEVTIIRHWIDNLPQASVIDTPVHGNSIRHQTDIYDERRSVSDVTQAISGSSICITDRNWVGKGEANDFSHVNIDKLLLLWLIHVCLLEGFVSHPVITATRIGSAVLCIIHVQNGCLTPGEGVAGTDESQRQDVLGIVEIGLEWLKSLGRPVPRQLDDLLDEVEDEFALSLLRISAKPKQYDESYLIGVAWAFAKLHEVVLTSGLLPPPLLEPLASIVTKETRAFENCINILKEDESLKGFEAGQTYGILEIENVFCKN